MPARSVSTKKKTTVNEDRVNFNGVTYATLQEVGVVEYLVPADTELEGGRDDQMVAAQRVQTEGGFIKVITYGAELGQTAKYRAEVRMKSGRGQKNLFVKLTRVADDAPLQAEINIKSGAAALESIDDLRERKRKVTPHYAPHHKNEGVIIVTKL